MEHENAMRGFLFNLIVYTHEKKRSDYFQMVVEPFIEKYPCKVIFIHSDDEEEKSTLEFPLIKEKKECPTCDEIVITASKSLLHQVPFLLLPRLVPDLPIYLVWGQNPSSDNELLSTLQKMATRFVFDSECASDLQVFCATILERIATLKIEFMDVSWANISGWRDVIAQTFNTQEKLDYLNQCNKIIIKYNKTPSKYVQHSAVQAIFLQGWLAAQLKWSYESISYNNEISLSYRTPQSKVNIVINPQQRMTLEPGKIFEVEFVGKDLVKTSMTFAEKQSKVIVYISTPEICELPFSHPIPDMSKGLTAMKEVFYYKASIHYTNMLEIIKQIPWKTF